MHGYVQLRKEIRNEKKHIKRYEMFDYLAIPFFITGLILTSFGVINSEIYLYRIRKIKEESEW